MRSCSGIQLRFSDEQMQEFKALAVRNRHMIKNYLSVSISEKLTPVAFPESVTVGIAQKLLDSNINRCKVVDRESLYHQVILPSVHQLDISLLN